MEFLREQVKELPQVLQDYIGEFNCEHRVFMKQVLDELKDRHDDKYECDNYDCYAKCYDEFVESVGLLYRFLDYDKTIFVLVARMLIDKGVYEFIDAAKIHTIKCC